MCLQQRAGWYSNYPRPCFCNASLIWALVLAWFQAKDLRILQGKTSSCLLDKRLVIRIWCTSLSAFLWHELGWPRLGCIFVGNGWILRLYRLVWPMLGSHVAIANQRSDVNKVSDMTPLAMSLLWVWLKPYSFDERYALDMTCKTWLLAFVIVWRHGIWHVQDLRFGQVVLSVKLSARWKL